jgi:hypothetical protein
LRQAEPHTDHKNMDYIKQLKQRAVLVAITMVVTPVGLPMLLVAVLNNYSSLSVSNDFHNSIIAELVVDDSQYRKIK